MSASHSEQQIVEKFEVEEEEQGKETCCEQFTSCRWILAYAGLFGFTVLYALRINLGLAIVCMVKPVNSNTTAHSVCMVGVSDANASTSILGKMQGGDLEWSKTLQGYVLSSFFYGYIITQIPGGLLSARFGGKIVMFVGMLTYGIATILLPFAAKYPKDPSVAAGLVITLRVIMGLATGPAFPAMHSLWGKWAPPYERSKLIVLCYSGTMVGNILMLGTGGYFCSWTSFHGGWPSMFYIGGGFCLLFCLVWWLLVFDSPAVHPRITMKEQSYISSSLENKEEQSRSAPWKSILSSPAVWAIVVCHSCNNFGNYTLLTKLPAFMKDVLGFDIKSNGLYSMLPYIAMFVVANTAAHVIDILREKQVLSTVLARKIAMTLAFIIPAGFLVGTGFIPCGYQYLGVIFLTCAVAFTGFNRSGYNTNHVDIAPRYAGELFGLTNTFSTIPGMVAPTLINAMTPNDSKVEWQRVFYVWAAVYITGWLVFTVLAKGKVQPWALDENVAKKSTTKSLTGKRQAYTFGDE